MGYGGTYPTTYRTITVGATNYTRNADGSYTDTRWVEPLTPAGDVVGSNWGACVSIWTPGAAVQVASKDNSGFPRITKSSGTSHASALVAGAVARLLQQYPTISATSVWTELVNRANGRNVAPPDLDPSAVVNRKLLYISATE
jgi:hypothetical protein